MRTLISQAPDHRWGMPQPRWRGPAPLRGGLRRASRLQGRLRQDLRVIHILYTVCGDHTTSSVNGQEINSAVAPLADG
jgi:hypothetical protein